MIGLLSDLTRTFKGGLERFRQREFMEACMAASALVAMADREVRLSERVALDGVLSNVEQLKVYDPVTAVNVHRGFVSELGRDFDSTKAQLLDLLVNNVEGPKDAELMVKVGLAIAKADNDYSDEEAEVLAEICERLGVPLSVIDQGATVSLT